MRNKEIAIKALQELFVKRDATALDKYWAESCIQHNPNMEKGHEGMRKVLPLIPQDFVYETGILVEEGNIVVAHSRVVGWEAIPQIVVDIFRFKEGKIVEHWDVIQDEIPAEQSKNGYPMTSFYSDLNER